VIPFAGGGEILTRRDCVLYFCFVDLKTLALSRTSCYKYVEFLIFVIEMGTRSVEKTIRLFICSDGDSEVKYK